MIFANFYHVCLSVGTTLGLVALVQLLSQQNILLLLLEDQLVLSQILLRHECWYLRPFLEKLTVSEYHQY